MINVKALLSGEEITLLSVKRNSYNYINIVYIDSNKSIKYDNVTELKLL